MADQSTFSDETHMEYNITIFHLLAAAAAFFVNLILSTYLSLGLNRRLIIAALRCGSFYSSACVNLCGRASRVYAWLAKYSDRTPNCSIVKHYCPLTIDS